MRLPYAAEVLIDQVQEQKPKATYEEGDPDGFDVVRTVKFDKATSKWLAPLLEVVEDWRIEEVNLTDAGYLHVTFIGGTDADARDPFPLDAAEQIVKAEQPQSGS